VTVSDPRQVENRRMGQESVHTTTLGEGIAISRGKLFDCNALWMEMKREGVGAGRAYHGEDEKMTAAEETMDDDGEFI